MITLAVAVYTVGTFLHNRAFPVLKKTFKWPNNTRDDIVDLKQEEEEESTLSLGSSTDPDPRVMKPASVEMSLQTSGSQTDAQAEIQVSNSATQTTGSEGTFVTCMCSCGRGQTIVLTNGRPVVMQQHFIPTPTTTGEEVEDISASLSRVRI